MRAASRWNASFLALVVLLISFVGAVPQSAEAAVTNNAPAGNPDHKVLVCHWTPAQGGKYVEIEVDHNSTKLQGHLAHENDVIDPPDGVCPQGEEDPEAEAVTVSVNPGDCYLDSQLKSKTYYFVDVNPSAGATLTVTGPDGYRAVYSGDGGDEVAPGTYHWAVEVAEGFTYAGPTLGSFVASSCEETTVDVAITVGGCHCDGEVSLQPYFVTISPREGATVTVTGPDGYLAVYSGGGGTDRPQPGTYHWSIELAPGYTTDAPLEGTFELEECEQPHEEFAVAVEVGACVWNGVESLTTYEMIIDAASHAMVTVTGPDGYEKMFMESGSDTVPPGTYYWTAELLHGYTTVDPLSGSFTVEACEPGEPLPAGLGDLVWHDIDGDGLQEAAEPGIEGVVVNLVVDGAAVATTSTDVNGIYGFTDLPAGDYTVEFEVPVGWIVTATDQGSDDAIDSDGTTVSTSLAEGETDLTLDLGLLMPATITVVKVVDPTTDDSFEFVGDVEAVLGDGESASVEVLPGEYAVSEVVPDGWLLEDITCTDGGVGDPATGVAGYSVSSGDEVSCTFTNTNTGSVTLEKVTDVATDEIFEFTVGEESVGIASGESVVLELPSGEYDITEDLLVVDGWELAQVVCSAGAEVDLEAGSARLFVPPGEQVGCTFVNSQAAEPLGVIGDYVWFDVDADGIQEATETGVEGALVELFVPGAATPLASTTTNAAGIYVFANVPQGDYQVRFTTPAGWMFTDAQQGGDDAIDSDVVQITAGSVDATQTGSPELPSVGTTDVFTLAAGATDVTIDAGIFRIQVQNVVVTPTPKTPPSSGPGVTPPTVGTPPTVSTPDVETRVLAAQTELPMTGLSNGGLGVVALILLGGGAVLLATTRRKEEELATAVGFSKRLRR